MCLMFTLQVYKLISMSKGGGDSVSMTAGEDGYRARDRGRPCNNNGLDLYGAFQDTQST